VIAGIKKTKEAGEQVTAQAIAPVAEVPPAQEESKPTEVAIPFTEREQPAEVNTTGVQALAMDKLANVPLNLTLQ